jgi:cobalt-zinc-cadmium efflux system outer membrane protein
MSARVFRIVAIGLCLAAPTTSVASAQTPVQSETMKRYVDETRGLRTDELVALALKNAPSILAARARVEAARGEVTQAGQRPIPTANIERREEVGGTDNLMTLGIMWPLDLSRRDARTSVARQQAVSAGHLEADAERLLASAVRSQIARLLASVRQVDVRERILTAARQTRDLLAARAESGAGTPLDRDIAEVESRRAEAELVRQRADADVALAELKALVGMTADATLLVSETLEVAARTAIAEIPALDTTTTATLIDARADVRAADSEIVLALARTDLFRREARPDVNLTGSYMQMKSAFPQFGLSSAGQPTPIRGQFHNIAIGASFAVPWRNRQQGTIAASVATETAARHEREALRLAASAEIDAARVREAQARRVWEIYSGGLRDLAARNLAVMQESQRLGRASLVDVLAETRRYLDVETACTDALLDLLNARIALARAIGVVR